MTLTDSFKQARRAGVPLIMVETPDPAACQKTILDSLNGKQEDTPVIRWDMVRGIFACNEAGKMVVTDIIPDGDPETTARPDEMFSALKGIPESTIVLLYGAEKIIANGDENAKFVRQAIWNLRDHFKSTGNMLVLMVPFSTKLSADIRDDVVVIEHALPNEEKLNEIATSIVEDAEIKPLDAATLAKTVDATLGLSEFAAEQVIAMSLTREGINTDTLWDRKRKAIEQTAGLKVWNGDERFSMLGGLANAKQFFTKLIKGKKPPRVIVFIDEIEKAIGSQQDSSGTSKEMLGTLLKWMEDKKVTGSLLIGVAGSGKSAISKALGNEAECPTIQFDMTAMKSASGGIVGQSSGNLEKGLATVDAIGQGRVMVLATCNSMGEMPPELKRRFKFSTMFFDLPTAEERKAIWDVCLDQYGVSGDLPNDKDWTGAEVNTCCEIADRLEISLIEAAEYIVPIAKSSKDVIDQLRREANGKYVSASYGGAYKLKNQTPAKSRKMEIE